MVQLDDTSSIEHAHAYRLQRLGRMLRNHLLGMVQPMGLSPEQFIILFRLHERDGQVQKELVDPAFDDRANITKLINQLAREGLVERQPDPDDGRSKRVFLTPKGRERVDGMLPMVVEGRQALWDGFEPEELDELLRLIGKLEQRLG